MLKYYDKNRNCDLCQENQDIHILPYRPPLAHTLSMLSQLHAHFNYTLSIAGALLIRMAYCVHIQYTWPFCAHPSLRLCPLAPMEVPCSILHDQHLQSQHGLCFQFLQSSSARRVWHLSSLHRLPLAINLTNTYHLGRSTLISHRGVSNFCPCEWLFTAED